MDRIERIEADIIATHGSMLEIIWDGVEGIVCLLAGKKVASAPTISELSLALEKWASESGLKRNLVLGTPLPWVSSAVELYDPPGFFINELYASRAF